MCQCWNKIDVSVSRKPSVDTHNAMSMLHGHQALVHPQPAAYLS